MKRRFRRTIAILSLLAGTFLIVVETRAVLRGDGLDVLFWLLVAMLLVALGATELLQRDDGTTLEKRHDATATHEDVSKDS